MKVTLTSGTDRVLLTQHPFQLSQKVNLSGLSANIITSDANTDGANFLRSNFQTRDVDLEGYIRVSGMKDSIIQKHRDTLYRVFNPKNKVIVEFEDENIYYQIEGYPVSFPVFESGFQNSNHSFQRFLLQLHCTDPFIYKAKKYIVFADVVPKFSFPLQFNSVVFGEKSTSGLIETVYNSGVMECPLEIKMKATNTVVNPSLLNVYSGEQIKFNTTLLPGEELYINTGRKKEISKITGNIKEPFYYALDLSSEMMNLRVGDNVFRFAADENEEYLLVEISYRERLGGI